MKPLLLLASCLASMAVPTVASAAGGELVGSWRLNVTCHDFNQVNIVSISSASQGRVLGTTNVGDAFGKITDGAFDGESFIFVNKYKWNGRTYTEKWTGKLSRNGRQMSGAFATNHVEAGPCRFRGSRQ